MHILSWWIWVSASMTHYWQTGRPSLYYITVLQSLLTKILYWRKYFKQNVRIKAKSFNPGLWLSFSDVKPLSGLSVIKLRLVLQWWFDLLELPLSHKGSLELSQSDHWVLAHAASQDPFSTVCSDEALRRVLVVPNVSPSRLVETTLLLGASSAADTFNL